MGMVTIRWESPFSRPIFFIENGYIGSFQYVSIIVLIIFPINIFPSQPVLVAVAGTVLFIGLTQFAEGTWLGVELDEAKGKNNGTVLREIGGLNHPKWPFHLIW